MASVAGRGFAIPEEERDEDGKWRKKEGEVVVMLMMMTIRSLVVISGIILMPVTIMAVVMM